MNWVKEQHGWRGYEGNTALAYVGQTSKGWWAVWLSENADGQWSEHDIRWHKQYHIYRNANEAKGYAEGLIEEREEANA